MKITLFLTDICNQTCSYCDIWRKTKKRIAPFSTFTKYIDIIKDNNDIDIVTLTGGEVSLIDEKYIDYIFKTLKDKKIIINTNGVNLF